MQKGFYGQLSDLVKQLFRLISIFQAADQSSDFF